MAVGWATLALPNDAGVAYPIADIGGHRRASLRVDVLMRYRRSDEAGAAYFFTVVTDGRRPILTAGDNPALLKAALAFTNARHRFRIDALVIMPDHLHCIWTLPPADADFAGRWSIIKSYFTRRCAQRDAVLPRASRASKGERAVWQRRYWEHRLRDENDFERHCDYTHYNPVKHGLATAPVQWPYSTFKRYVEKGVYPLDWGTKCVAFEPRVGRE